MDAIRIILSFMVGGLICASVQIISDKTKMLPAKILVFLVVLGVFLGATGIYDFIFDIAGAGISVPLIGFGASVARGVKETIDKLGAIGILSGPFTAASTGLGAAFIFAFICSLLFKSKPKRS